MKIDENVRPDTAATVPSPDVHDSGVELTPHWDTALRARVRRFGTTVFACTVTPREASAWLVTDCLPQRRDVDLPVLLLEVAGWLAAEHAVTETIMVHPAFWDEQMAAGGAVLLQLIVPMWLSLDQDLLFMHSRPVPDPYVLAPLDASVDSPELLAQLSSDVDRDVDLRTWQGVLSGDYGPIIRDASLTIMDGSTLRAAVAVTEYHGAPLVGHIVTATAERGTGLGRALLVESMKGLSASGYVDCHLNVAEDNWTARRLYRSIGFVQAGPTLRVSYLRPRQARDV